MVIENDKPTLKKMFFQCMYNARTNIFILFKEHKFM